MKYVLENEEESNRLKLQEDIGVYHLSNDLADFEIGPKDIVLDAGCGAGLISLYLRKNYNFQKLYSCDFSDLRIKQAKNFLTENRVHGTDFFQCDLSSIPLNDETVSKVVCRFVYEYLAEPIQVTRELYRICRPGGKVRLIDLDGVVVNLQSENKELNAMLEKLQKNSLQKYNLDFFAGRKLFTFMKLAGFQDIQCHVRPMYFNKDDIKKEKANYIERFSFAKNILEDTFQGQANRFIKMYLEELDNDKNLLFYNNFVVTGSK